MHGFCKKVVEYLYENRLNQFLSSFYELYSKYKHLGEEAFMREWFDKAIIRELLAYFPPSVIIKSFEEVINPKRQVFKTYIKVYWDFCRNPSRHKSKISEALEFFGLKELSEEELKAKYRELVRSNHPDIVGKTKEAHMMMVRINYYYQILRRYLSDRRERTVQIR